MNKEKKSKNLKRRKSKITKHESNIRIPQKTIEQEIILFKIDFDEKEKDPKKDIESIIIYKWAIWIRKLNHFPSYSNHSIETHGIRTCNHLIIKNKIKLAKIL